MDAGAIFIDIKNSFIDIKNSFLDINKWILDIKNYIFDINKLKLSAQPYGRPNAKYAHFFTCTRYLMCM